MANLVPETEQASRVKARIETRAYELYLERGAEDGHAFEDWLSAETELMQIAADADAPLTAKAATAGHARKTN